MELYCNDVDLLVWEPLLFGGYEAAGQTAAQGEGVTVAGTTLTDPAGSFLACGVQAGMVVRLWREGAGSDELLEVMAVESETAMTVSRLRMGREGAVLTPALAGDGLSYRIVTYLRQIEETGAALSLRCGMSELGGTLVNPEALRQVCALGTVAAVLQGCCGLDEVAVRHAQQFGRLYGRALESVCLLLDMDGDGYADRTVAGRTVAMKRV